MYIIRIIILFMRCLKSLQFGGSVRSPNAPHAFEKKKKLTVSSKQASNPVILTQV